MKVIKIIAIGILLCCGQYSYSQLSATSKIDAPSLKIGEQTVFRIAAHIKAGEKVTFPPFTDTLIKNVMIVGVKTDTIVEKEDPQKLSLVRQLTITSFEPGTYNIPSFTVSTGSQKANTQPATLEFTNVAVDTSKAFYDIKQPMQVEYGILDWLRDNWHWILLAIVAIAAAIAAFIYLRKRPRKAAVPLSPKPSESEDARALRRLNELKNRSLWQTGEVKLYYSELTDILREYLEARFGIQTMEKTTAEIFTSMRQIKNISQDNKAELRQILEVADLVKFAKGSPLPEENKAHLEYAIEFVNKSRRAAEITEKEQGHV